MCHIYDGCLNELKASLKNCFTIFFSVHFFNTFLQSLSFTTIYFPDVKCPRISPLINGGISPPACVSQPQVVYRTVCYFMCNVSQGYIYHGPLNVTCLENGVWSNDPNTGLCKGLLMCFIYLFIYSFIIIYLSFCRF